MSVATVTDVSLLAWYRTDLPILTERPCNVLVEGGVPRRFDRQSIVSPRPLA